MTAENCTCRICRNLGYFSYIELRALVSELDNELTKRGLPGVDPTLEKRITNEEQFRQGAFQGRHLQAESHIASHCMCHLLTSHVDPRFCQPCSHTRSDGTTGEPPATMEHLLGRKPTNDDWNTQCEVGRCWHFHAQHLFTCVLGV